MLDNKNPKNLNEGEISEPMLLTDSAPDALGVVITEEKKKKKKPKKTKK